MSVSRFSQGLALASVAILILSANIASAMTESQFQTIKYRAEQGDPAAEFKLGYAYSWNVRPVQPNLTAYWIRKAADQGYARAEWWLGETYSMGGKEFSGINGIPKNNVIANNWYKKAANQGFAPAENFLGDDYYFGDGVPQNTMTAISWWKLAAEQKSIWGSKRTAEENLANIKSGRWPTIIPIAKEQKANWPRKYLEREEKKLGPICGAYVAAVRTHTYWRAGGKPKAWAWQKATVHDLLIARNAGLEAGGWNVPNNKCFAYAENFMARDLMNYDFKSSTTIPVVKKIVSQCEDSRYSADCKSSWSDYAP